MVVPLARMVGALAWMVVALARTVIVLERMVMAPVDTGETRAQRGVKQRGSHSTTTSWKQRGTKMRAGTKEQARRTQLSSEPDTAPALAELYNGTHTLDELSYLVRVFGKPAVVEMREKYESEQAGW